VTRYKDHGFASGDDFCQRLGFSLILGCYSTGYRVIVRLTTPLAQLVSCVIGFSGVPFSLVTRPSFVSDVGRCLDSRGSGGTNIYSV
jgi:hypothetical protein